MSGSTIAEKDRSPGVIPTAPWRVTTLAVLPGYRMDVEFRDGTRGVADFSALVRSPKAGLFTALADPEFFACAKVDCGVITWPNGADMDPAWMHEAIRGDRGPQNPGPSCLCSLLIFTTSKDFRHPDLDEGGTTGCLKVPPGLNTNAAEQSGVSSRGMFDSDTVNAKRDIVACGAISISIQRIVGIAASP